MYVLLFVADNIISPYERSHRLKWYQTVRQPRMYKHLVKGPQCCYTYIACTFVVRDVRYSISGFRREVHENCGPYLRSGTTSRYYIEHFKMGPIGYPETSVRNYHYTLRNNPEELSSLRKLRIKYQYFSLKLQMTFK